MYIVCRVPSCSSSPDCRVCRLVPIVHVELLYKCYKRMDITILNYPSSNQEEFEDFPEAIRKKSNKHPHRGRNRKHKQIIKNRMKTTDQEL